jgi:hypothetical protein
VSTGRDRQIWSGDGQAREPVWTRDGIFFYRDFDLWAVEPRRPGVAHRIGPNPPSRPSSESPPVFFGAIANGAAWALVPSVPSRNGPVTNDVVLRMNMADGTVTRWYQAPPGSTLSVLGLDAQGRLLLGIADPMRRVGNLAYELAARGILLLAGRDQAIPVPLPDPALAPDRAFADAHGVWISGADALWLLRDGRLTRVATVPARLRPRSGFSQLPGEPAPAVGPAAVVMGACT